MCLTVYQDPAMESIHKNLKLLLLCYVLDSKTQESILSLLHKFKSKERTPLWRDLQSGSSPMLIELIDFYTYKNDESGYVYYEEFMRNLRDPKMVSAVISNAIVNYKESGG